MPDASTSQPTGRLAPSPTGGLHLGHARTFLLAWLSIRSQKGRMLLRVEDLDATRARPGAGEAAMVDLRWLGLDWDEGPDIGGPHGPYVQSGRMERYAESLERLKGADLVYPCTCTRADIERAASAPHPEDEGPVYPGTCSGRRALDAEGLVDRPFAWRFRVPPGRVAWRDQFLGEQSVDPRRLGGDFVVARSSLGPSYQLAVVHDDATMGVSEVIRGDDLVPSTPRQILLYRALGGEPPRFGHTPRAVGPDGRRLAKRDGAIKLASLRDEGVDPRSLVGWLARSCFPGLGDELARPVDLIERFDLAVVPREPWTVTLPILEGR